jgi:hypothetical protein
MRRTFILVLILLAMAALPVHSDENVPTSEYDPTVEKAVERGLEWLASKQQDSGAWLCKVGYKLNSNYIGKEAEHVGTTALAGMAFLASGHTPGRGKYGLVVEKALNFILDSVRPEDGYITRNGSRMYSHAFATLFLAEIYGMNRQDTVKEKLRQAVNVLIYSQNKEGGWRYQPTPVDADLSVTVSTVQALRAARNVGISVPQSTVDKAMEYVKSCWNENGTFNYQNLNRFQTRETYALTACGVTSLFSAGEYRTQMINKSINYLHARRNQELHAGYYHFFYGHYYTIQVMHHAGGKHWKDYWRDLRSMLLKKPLYRDVEGYWSDDVGDTYATAMACLLLSIPNEYLPIFQK